MDRNIMRFIVTLLILVVLTSSHSPAQLSSAPLCLPVCDSVAVDWLLIMTSNQSDSAVGGTLSQTTVY